MPKIQNSRRAGTSKTGKRRNRKSPQRKRGARVSTFSAPMALTTIRKQLAPSVSSRKGGLTVNHSILMQVVTGSATDPFHVNSVGLQPGDPTHLPWLANIARNYETYKVNSISARYIPTCASTTSGRLLFYWEYDVNDSPPSDYVAASAQWHATATAPWKGVSVSGDVRKIHAQFPQKRVTEAFEFDFRSDLASFVICRTSGTAGGWGEVWLDFNISFSTPTYNAGGATGIVRVGSQTVYSAPEVSTPSQTNSWYVPFSPIVEEPDIDECNLGALSAPTGVTSGSSTGVAGGNAVFLPQGTWSIEYSSENVGPFAAPTAADRVASETRLVVGSDPTTIRSSPDSIVAYGMLDQGVAVSTVASHETRPNYLYSIVVSPQVGTYIAAVANIFRAVSSIRTVVAGANMVITYLGGGTGSYERMLAKQMPATFAYYKQQATLDLLRDKLKERSPSLLSTFDQLRTKELLDEEFTLAPQALLRAESSVPPFGVVLRSLRSPESKTRELPKRSG